MSAIRRQRSRRAPTMPPITPPAIGPALLLLLVPLPPPVCVLGRERGGGTDSRDYGGTVRAERSDIPLQ